MLKKVTLYGELGEKFGKNWNLDIANPHEITKAIEANKPGFIEFILEREYHVVIGDKGLSNQTQLLDPIGSSEVKIIPVIHGSKSRGLGMILLGALIVFAPYAAGLYVTGGGAGVATFSSTWALGLSSMTGMGITTAVSVSSFALKAGAALMLMGVSQLLAPKPKKPESTEVDNGQSYNFNGPVNTVSQGLPIPLCYGELVVGGALISASISSKDTSG